MISRIIRDLLRPTVWVTAERVFTEVFSLTLFAVQARLLGPTAFGLIAAVMVFISFWDAVPMNAVLEALVSVRRIEETALHDWGDRHGAGQPDVRRRGL